MKNSLNKLLSAKADNILDRPSVKILPLFEDVNYPILITPNTYGVDLGEWIRSQRQTLEDNLSQYGAILFRGFDINTVEKFQQFLKSADVKPLEYKHRSSPRFEVAKNIYNSTSHPADQSINMHSESSYADKYIKNIVFCCIKPPGARGETPVADNRKVLTHISENTLENFRTKGVRYIRNLSSWMGLPWQEVFQTEDRILVEKDCVDQNINFHWKDNDDLTLSWNREALRLHPITGQEVWFNHAFFFNKYTLPDDFLSSIDSDDELPFNTLYGDGSVIPREVIDEIAIAYRKATVEFAWSAGDVLYLDNILASHGRNSYDGERQIVVSMF